MHVPYAEDSLDDELLPKDLVVNGTSPTATEVLLETRQLSFYVGTKAWCARAETDESENLQLLHDVSTKFRPG